MNALRARSALIAGALLATSCGGSSPAGWAPAPRPAASSAWPSAANTGVPRGTVLKPSGSLQITRDGQVVDSLDVQGTIEVDANNVVIRRTRVRAGAPWLIRVDDGVSGVAVRDSELDGLGSSDSVGIGWTGFVAERLDIHSTEDGVRASDRVIVRDSWVHDLTSCGTCHSDGVQSTGGRHIAILHNTIETPHPATSCILLKGDLSAIDDVLIADNLLDGGAYTVYSVAGKSFGTPTNVSVVNNRFGRRFIYGIRDLEGEVIWSANSWADTGAPAG